MKTPLIYQWKANCENRIAEIKQELIKLQSQPKTPEIGKEIEQLEDELCEEYMALADYQGRIISYEYECENY